MSDNTAGEQATGHDWENVPAESGAAPHTDVPTGTGLDNGQGYTLVYPPADRVAETAHALNQAAEGREHEVVWSDGAFRVPDDIASAANLDGEVNTVEDVSAVGGSQHGALGNGTSTANGAAGAAGRPVQANGTGPTNDPLTGAAQDGTDLTGGGQAGNPDSLSDLNIDELREHARANGISLAGATRKQDIIKAIESHQQ